VLGALHHGVEDPSSIWRTTVGEVVAMREELVLLVQVWELATPSHSHLLLPMQGRVRRVRAHTQDESGSRNEPGACVPLPYTSRVAKVGGGVQRDHAVDLTDWSYAFAHTRASR
jgi:hypothetical protein